MKRMMLLARWDQWVICGIGVWLMLILGAVGSQGRQQARSVVCQATLRRWGIIMLQYTEGNEGKFPDRSTSDGKGRWIYAVDYPEELRLCPEATRTEALENDVSWWGANHKAWNIPPNDAGGGREIGTYGSYGINGYVYDSQATLMGFVTEERLWRTPKVTQASEIPMLMDAILWAVFPQSTNRPPSVSMVNAIDVADEQGMQRVCLDRHGGAINTVFLDGAVRLVGLKELWTLKWHRGYDTAGPWTQAGGVQPEDWPEWMRDLPDY